MMTEQQRFVQTEYYLRDIAQRVRYTVQGKKCAPYSRVDGHDYPGCTKHRDPSNGNSNQEWCYIDPSEKADKKWDFCKKITLDYDELRKQSAIETTQQKILMNQVFSELNSAETKTTQMTKTLLSIEESYPSVQAITDKHALQAQKIFKNYEFIKTSLAENDILVNKIKGIKKDIQDLESSKQKVDPKDCRGMLGYEADTAGDGLTGYYYDNEFFKGKFLTKQVPNINSFWNKSPMEGINYDNFAVKYFGWIRIPKDGSYTFILRSDQSVRLKINGQTVIQSGFDLTKLSWLISHGDDIKDTKTSNGTQIYSRGISLKGGFKYRIQVEMIRTVHREHTEGKPFIQLLWSTDWMEKNVIDSQYLYNKNEDPPAKTANFDPELMELKIMKEQINAFKDDDSYILDDVPIKFQGASFLRSVYDYKNQHISIKSDQNVDLYVAIDDNQKSFLPSYFTKTDEVVSILVIRNKAPIKFKNVASNGEQIKKEGQHFRASESRRYSIYFKTFEKGSIDIQLQQTGDKKSFQFLLFFQSQTQNNKKLSCGGDQVLISDPTNTQIFKSCDQSSKFVDVGWDCKSAFSKKMEDGRQFAWATSNQGIGAWIKLNTKQQYQISKIEFKQRNNPAERNNELEIIYGNDKSESINAKNIGDIQDFELKSEAITSQVTIKIKSVYGTINNGGSFNIYGIPCLDSKSQELTNDEPSNQQGSQKADLKAKVFDLRCLDSIKNNPELKSQNLNEGDQFIIKCNDCSSYQDAKIYGDVKYSLESSLCRAASHSGSLQGKGQVSVKIIENHDAFAGQTRQGITSLSKEVEEQAIKFIPVKKDDILVNDIRVGQQMDYFEPTSKSWIAATVTQAKIINDQNTKLSLIVDGQNNVIELNFPGNNIDYCGVKIKTRKCDQMSKPPNSNRNSISFNFGKEKVNGYVLDEGKEFSKQGEFTYGWSKDNQINARTRQSGGSKLLNNLIMFPPNKETKFCKDNKLIDCSLNEWKANVQPGYYNIKVNLGDPDYASKYDLTIQGKPSFSKYLQKGQFEDVVSNNVDIVSGTLTLSAECKQECQFSWTRINTVQLTKINQNQNQNNNEPQQTPANETIKLGCGLAFMGGRCDNGIDILNCIYNTTDQKGVQGCYSQFKLVRISDSYQCPTQRHLHKCVKIKYQSREECIEQCPGKCDNQNCLAKKEVPDKQKGVNPLLVNSTTLL